MFSGVKEIFKAMFGDNTSVSTAKVLNFYGGILVGVLLAYQTFTTGKLDLAITGELLAYCAVNYGVGKKLDNERAKDGSISIS